MRRNFQPMELRCFVSRSGSEGVWLMSYLLSSSSSRPSSSWSRPASSVELWLRSVYFGAERSLGASPLTFSFSVNYWSAFIQSELQEWNPIQGLRSRRRRLQLLILQNKLAWNRFKSGKIKKYHTKDNKYFLWHNGSRPQLEIHSCLTTAVLSFCDLVLHWLL